MPKRLSSKVRKIDSFIGTNSTLSGDIFSKSSLCVEGVVEGNIFADGAVIVGKAAYISGNIEAHNTAVSGKVKGNIIVRDYARLTATCIVDGDIHAANFIADEGSVFNGKCYMNNKDSTPIQTTEDEEA
ncbi:MAG: polymer-forming cytoskeletal protein [Clostridiales bacterium]|nr:polymer-forming cytoskeletal protein [Clostridiales bacterium]